MNLVILITIQWSESSKIGLKLYETYLKSKGTKSRVGTVTNPPL